MVPTTQDDGVLREWADRMFKMVQDQLQKTDSLTDQNRELERKVSDLCNRISVLESKSDTVGKHVEEIFNKCENMNTHITKVDIRSGLIGGVVGLVGGLISVAITLLVIYIRGHI